MTHGTAVLELTIANTLGPRRPGRERTAAQCLAAIRGDNRGDTNV